MKKLKFDKNSGHKLWKWNSHFYLFLMAVIRYNFRKTYQIKKKLYYYWFLAQKWPIYPNFGIIKIFVKKKGIFTNSLMPAFRCNFKKTYWADFEKSSSMLILGSKMTHS